MVAIPVPELEKSTVEVFAIVKFPPITLTPAPFATLTADEPLTAKLPVTLRLPAALIKSRLPPEMFKEPPTFNVPAPKSLNLPVPPAVDVPRTENVPATVAVTAPNNTKVPDAN